MRDLRQVTILLGVWALVGTAVGGASSADPVCAGAPADFEVDVHQLLNELSSPVRDQRSLAEKRLRALGPRVLPLLPAPELLPSASVREAVRRLRIELERDAARESVLASRVTIHGMLPAREAFEEMTRQTGNRLDASGLPANVLERSIDLNFNSVSFWEAIDDLAGRLNGRYDFDSAGRGLTLGLVEDDNRPGRSAVSYAGAFRLAALPPERIRRGTNRPADQQVRARDDLLRVTLLLMPEPRLRPLFLQLSVNDISARLATGVELKALSPGASYELPVAETGGLARIQLEYLLPETVPGALLRLKGKMRCTTAAGNESIRFSDLAAAGEHQDANIARRRGGVTVTLNRAEATRSPRGSNEARLQVTVAYDTGGPAFESHQTWMLHNDVFLEDPAGRRVRLNGGCDTKRQGEGGVALEYRFVDLARPVTDYAFVYVVPTLIIDVPVEFEIQSALMKKP